MKLKSGKRQITESKEPLAIESYNKPKESGTWTYVKNNFRDWARKLGVLYLYAGSLEVSATILYANSKPDKIANLPIYGVSPTITFVAELLPLLTLGGYAVYREVKDFLNQYRHNNYTGNFPLLTGFLATAGFSTAILATYCFDYFKGSSSIPINLNHGASTAEAIAAPLLIATLGTYYVADKFILKRRKKDKKQL
jgi:hypothetical protein